MAYTSLYSASSALNALQTSLDVTANNLANVNTEGFKGSRANFQDLLYEERAQPGTENAIGDQRPTGLYVGLGTKVSGTQVDFRQGPLQITERPLDVAIEGRGFFIVQVEDNISEGVAYTRSGNFTLNANGEIVLANDQGRRVLPIITVPEDALGISILPDGSVQVSLPGESDPTEIGQFEIATFVNPTGLKQIGENLFGESAASGPPISGPPAESERGRLLQGFLEASNVDPVIELVSLIKTQRAFEINSQSVQAADEILQNIGRLRSF